MSIESFRDVVIIISGLLSTAAFVFIAALSYVLFRKIKPTLEEVRSISAAVKSICSYAGEHAAKPLIQLAALMQGVQLGIDTVAKVFRQAEGGKNEQQ